MNLGRRRHGRGNAPADPPPADDVAIDARELSHLFEPPPWVRELGLLAWFLVGVGVALLGLIWILGETSTIVVPVVVGGIVAAVGGPAVASLQRHGWPRAAGAALVLLALLVLAVVVFLLVVGGIVENGDCEIERRVAGGRQLGRNLGERHRRDEPETSDAKADVKKRLPDIGTHP